YAIAADLSEMELKKILIEKMEGNKSMQRSDEQRNLYKARPPTPDRDWNKTFPAAQGDAQSCISELARQSDARSSFNELFNTPIDFSNFIMNRLGVATLTPELLARALSSKGEWKTFNWELKATRRGSTLRSPTRTVPI
nr:hypothetical protein [Tanacetum cinerariifolium]